MSVRVRPEDHEVRSRVGEYRLREVSLGRKATASLAVTDILAAATYLETGFGRDHAVRILRAVARALETK